VREEVKEGASVFVMSGTWWPTGCWAKFRGKAPTWCRPTSPPSRRRSYARCSRSPRRRDGLTPPTAAREGYGARDPAGWTGSEHGVPAGHSAGGRARWVSHRAAAAIAEPDTKTKTKSRTEPISGPAIAASAHSSPPMVAAARCQRVLAAASGRVKSRVRVAPQFARRRPNGTS
jgi:hypothetical protein